MTRFTMHNDDGNEDVRRAIRALYVAPVGDAY